ncbi:MAG: hypothetical protein KJP18_06900 [Gemmatimonadetes bacterium]|nr:hypothetical protein [Gemmatimonadota bacterium]NNF38428.1 hypothetical protein [Gemmatimonadota bacterium]NNK62550.1 hypothetical protein [Gemmatimonadota bacterium]
MNDSLAPWKALGRGALVLRLAAVGAVSGIVSWGLVVAIGGRGGLPPTEPGLLGTAVVKGIVVGSLMALVLHWWWHRDEIR